MSLLEEAMDSYIIMNKLQVDDGYGGVVTTWTEGARIKCAMQYNNSMEAKIAEAQGVKSVYTLTTTKDVILKHDTVLRRVSDGKIFRVTSNGEELKTPRSAGLDMRNVSAEEWELPNG